MHTHGQTGTKVFFIGGMWANIVEILFEVLQEEVSAIVVFSVIMMGGSEI